MLRRRRFLSAIALGPVVVSLAPVGLARAEDDPHRPARAGSPARTRGEDERLELDASHALGRDLQLAGGFSVIAAYELHCGALPFVLEGEGQRFQVDVLRRDASGPAGVFDTERLSLFVHDHGSPATTPTYVRGARALGAALERRLAAGASCPRLSSFLERRAHHPTERYAVDFERAPSSSEQQERDPVVPAQLGS